jgi:hypothetical protein
MTDTASNTFAEREERRPEILQRRIKDFLERYAPRDLHETYDMSADLIMIVSEIHNDATRQWQNYVIAAADKLNALSNTLVRPIVTPRDLKP